jgi:NAD(P)-dependent dehydrogenase (short-subunit alcohol dehydrogenase family)
MPDNPVRLRFSHKVALVSGAGSGIGRAVAAGLAREGASVALLGRTRSKLEETAERLPRGRSLVVTGMHEDPLDAARAVRGAVEAFGGLDVLVNNAGVFVGGTAADTRDDSWGLAIAANLTGPFLLTREALPALRRRHGSIVNVGSTLGERPIPGALPYAVSKAGLAMLTIATALEEASHGVRVNAVAPGVVDTPIHRTRIGEDPLAIEKFLSEMGALHPLGRIGTPEEVAAAIIFLASDDSTWTTGAVLPVDGGILLKNDK